MQHRSISHRTLAKSLAGAVFACAGLLGAVPVAVTPCARADVVAYLVNVTVRPGYNFANADAALSYGHGICDKVSQGRSYAQVMGDVKADFNTSDEYPGLVSDQPGGQRTVPGADLAVAKFGSTLPATARWRLKRRRSTCTIGR